MDMSKVSETLKATAYEYFKLGCQIIPFKLEWDEAKQEWDKQPLVEWKPLEETRQTLEQFEALPWSTANAYAVLCGYQLTDGTYITAIDFDTKKLSEEVVSKGREVLKLFKLVTRRERTISKGEHLIYRTKVKPLRNIKAYHGVCGLELLCDKIPLIMYPSKGYERVNDNDLTTVKDVTVLFYDTLAKAGIDIKRDTERQQAWFDRSDLQGKYKGSMPPCINMLLAGTTKGNRNDYGIRLTGYFLNFKGLSTDKVLKVLKEWNKRNDTKLDDTDLEEMIRFALQGHYRYGCHDPILLKFCAREECELAPEEEELKEQETYSQDVEAEINAEVQRIIDSDNQLDVLSKHLDRLAVGEENTKKAITILNLSGKSSNPETKQIILLKAEPGSGKSQLMRKLTQGYKVKDVGRFSAHALDYANLEGFEILRLKELGSMDEEKQGLSTVKFLSSDDLGYTVEITAKDGETGRFTTEQYKIPPITTISSTTRLVLDAQFERRAWLFGMDETPEQTKKIAEWKAKAEAQNAEKALGFRKITDFEFSSEVYKRFIERFQFKEIIIPFPSALLDLLGYEVLRIRGDMDKLLNFVKLYGQLNLKRLRLIKGDVYALSPQVTVEALNIVIEPLTGMLSRIDKRTTQVFETLKSIVDLRKVVERPSEPGQEPIAHETEIHYDGKNAVIDKRIREKIAVKLGKSEQTIRRFFTDLENSGYVSGDGKKPKTFTLLYDVSNIETKLSGLLAKTKSADTLMLEMEKETQEWVQKLSVNGFLLEGIKNTENKTNTTLDNTETEKNSPSTEKPLTNPSLPPIQAALSEKPSDNRLIPKLPIVQRDTANLGIPCPECKAQGKRMFFNCDADLKAHLENYHRHMSDSDYVR
jgi:hypothetical protein